MMTTTTVFVVGGGSYGIMRTMLFVVVDVRETALAGSLSASCEKTELRPTINVRAVEAPTYEPYRHSLAGNGTALPFH
jgi:hypothetical protein